MGYRSERTESTIRINQQHENAIVERIIKYLSGDPIKTWSYNHVTKRLNQVDFPWEEKRPHYYICPPEDFGETPETSTLDYYFQHLARREGMVWDLQGGYYCLRAASDYITRYADDRIIEFLAPYIEDQGEAEYLGEDSEQWKIIIQNGKAYTVSPTVITKWTEPTTQHIIGGYI